MGEFPGTQTILGLYAKKGDPKAAKEQVDACEEEPILPLDVKLAAIQTQVLAKVDPSRLLDGVYTTLADLHGADSGIGEDAEPMSGYQVATSSLEADIEAWDSYKKTHPLLVNMAAIKVLATIGNIKLQNLQLEGSRNALEHLLGAFKLQAENPAEITQDLCQAIIACYESILADNYSLLTPPQKEEHAKAKDLFIDLQQYLGTQNGHGNLATVARKTKESILSIKPDRDRDAQKSA